MTHDIALTEDYHQFIVGLKQTVQSAQIRAARAANADLPYRLPTVSHPAVLFTS
jgi:hypothetical protein